MALQSLPDAQGTQRGPIQAREREDRHMPFTNTRAGARTHTQQFVVFTSVQSRLETEGGAETAGK